MFSGTTPFQHHNLAGKVRKGAAPRKREEEEVVVGVGDGEGGEEGEETLPEGHRADVRRDEVGDEAVHRRGDRGVQKAISSFQDGHEAVNKIVWILVPEEGRHPPLQGITVHE
jgi:hypothetical protein